MNEAPSELETQGRDVPPKPQSLASLPPFIVYEASSDCWRITCPTRFTNHADALVVASKLNAFLASSADAWRDA